MKAAQIKAKILSNQRLSGNYWHLEFESGRIAKHAVAGQFVNIRVTQGPAPLLRRPISIHRVKGAKVKLFYEVSGAGTQILSTRKPGELLDIIGPLGNGFQFRPSAIGHRPSAILIAGGMGVAPLVFLAQRLLRPSGARNDTMVLIGAKTKEQILCAQEFKTLGCGVKLATDDGSVGFRGKVTDLLQQQLSAIGHRPSAIYACGPHLMLKAVAEMVNEYKINAQLSLEEHMACGLGACLGCAVKTKAGYKTVCKDGPVFSGEELIW